MKPIKQFVKKASVISLSLLSPFALAASYDTVILNGRVIDPETKFDAIANIGIKDNQIVTITTDAISGDKTIDATGKVVAPGFIDVHAH
ncbi:amidohydrolase family protein, partial [Vibrio vulnificus]